MTEDSKRELIYKLGKNNPIEDYLRLSSVLIYESGVCKFDNYLKYKKKGVIQIIKRPKGLEIKFAYNLSSISHGLLFSEISNILLLEKSETSKLIIETFDKKINFSFNTLNINQIKYFLHDINFEYVYVNSNPIKVDIYNPFSFKGKINRLEYIIYFSYYVIITGLFKETKDDLILTVIVYTFLYWLLLAQGAKRCRDIGKSGWYQLIPFYVLWLMFAKSK